MFTIGQHVFCVEDYPDKPVKIVEGVIRSDGEDDKFVSYVVRTAHSACAEYLVENIHARYEDALRAIYRLAHKHREEANRLERQVQSSRDQAREMLLFVAAQCAARGIEESAITNPLRH